MLGGSEGAGGNLGGPARLSGEAVRAGPGRGQSQGERRWHQGFKGERRPDYGGLHRAGECVFRLG